MKHLKKFLDFFLYSNIFISVCAGAMTVETYSLIHSEINWLYISFVFFATLLLYNFPVFVGDGFFSDYSERHKWVSENKKLMAVISVIAFLAVAVLVFFFPWRFFLSFVPIAIIAFAYFFPQTQLRIITGLKTTIVTIVWTSVTVIFPLLLVSDFDFKQIFSGTNGVVTLQNFFFMFPLCVIFNVRDIEADRNAGVKTFPVIYGVKKTIGVCMLSLIIFVVLILTSSPLREGREGFLFSSVASGVLILFASEKRSDYYYTLWIDGVILLQVGLVVLQSFLNSSK